MTSDRGNYDLLEALRGAIASGHPHPRVCVMDLPVAGKDGVSVLPKAGVNKLALEAAIEEIQRLNRVERNLEIIIATRMAELEVKLVRKRADEAEAQVKQIAWENYQLCGLICDELGISADAARATAASRRPEQSASFTCPKCNRISHNSNDLEDGYCGACSAFTGQAKPGEGESDG